MMNRWRNALILATAGLVTLASLGGCNQTPRAARNAIIDYQVGDYAAAADMLKPTITKKDENYVLNNCRFGSASLAAGRPADPAVNSSLSDLDNAEHSFFEVYNVMNATHVNDPGRSTGAMVVFEGVKVWTGEPFERAMAHYYLGLIYLIKHDYGNARAAFQNSIFKVREYASKDDLEHYTAAESNFALGYFGLAYANMRLGRADLAAQNFALAQSKDPTLAGVIADVQRPGVNALLFVDFGRGPQRAAKGWYNEESAFGPDPLHAPPIPPIVATVDGRTINQPRQTYRMLDTLAMAQEQRWQDIDTIKKVKAVIGTGAMAAGAGMATYGAEKNDKGLFWAGVGTTIAGAAIAASSQSDLRYWELLPRTVYIIPVSLPPGPHDITVAAGNSQSGILHVVIPPPSPTTPPDNAFYFRLRGY